MGYPATCEGVAPPGATTSLTRYTLRLQPEPRAASDARRWVRSMCADLGRDDLAACAQLGVSELVTNALLHAATPIGVGVASRAETLRVEVSDGSPQVPVLIAPPAGADPLSTVGRGLTILSRCATAWGARVGEAGKTVWFEPETEPREDGAPVSGVVDWSPAATAPVASPRGFTIVDIRGLPAADFADLEVHYNSLKRELSLLSLDRARDSHDSRDRRGTRDSRDSQDAQDSLEYRDGGLAEEFTRVAADFDALFEPGAAPGSPTRIEEPSRDGLSLAEEHLTLRTTIGTHAPEVIDRMRELFERADEFARDQRLLALALTPRQRELQKWFVTELARQARGRSPRRWPGYAASAPTAPVASPGPSGPTPATPLSPAASVPLPRAASRPSAAPASPAASAPPAAPAPAPTAGT